MYNQEYLTNLIKERVEENINLDYKAAAALERTDKKVKEICKDVSAFANSAGGVIIYGLKEDAINKHLASEIDPVSRSLISKEWLEQIILSSIQPRLIDFKIHPIEIDGDIEKVVYIVEINKGETAYQANDHRYYRRFNFLSVPMHDYEIRDILNRPKNPTIALKFVITNYEGEDSYYLDIYAVNTSAVLARYINCAVNVPTKCFKDYDDEYGRSHIQLLGRNIVRERTGEVINLPMQQPKVIYGPSRYDPLLPKMTTKLNFKEIRLNEYYDVCEIEWTIYADNAEPISGVTNMHNAEKHFE